MIDIRDREFTTLQDLADLDGHDPVIITPDQAATIWLLRRDQPNALADVTFYSVCCDDAMQHLDPAPSPTGP